MNLLNYLDPLFIIKTLGFIGVVAIVFAESGLFFGFFLPGDSLLFTAGLLSSQGLISFWPLFIFCIISAIVGDSVGYSFGKKTGPMLFSREDSFFFKKAHAEKARNFYEKYGRKTIIIARFVPIVRTFAPIVAGVAQMEYKTFLRFNIIGGVLWVTLLLGAGYVLGNSMPNIEQYLSYIIIFIILVSVIPVVYEILKNRK